MRRPLWHLLRHLLGVLAVLRLHFRSYQTERLLRKTRRRILSRSPRVKNQGVARLHSRRVVCALCNDQSGQQPKDGRTLEYTRPHFLTSSNL